MFGYIYVNQKELSLPDRNTYQAYYCGLCQCLKKDHGLRGQMLLTYDMSFLIVLLSGLYELKPEIVRFICPLHPGKKKTAFWNEATEYAASMNVMLAYNNFLDDWKDDHAYSKKVMSQLIRKDYEKAERMYPRQARALEEYMKKLDQLERSNEQNMDAIAGLTGTMLAEIFDWKGDIWSEELRCMGFYMGKFIYLMDAYEDLESDIRKKEYNPFAEMAKDNPKDYETISKLILTSMMSECARSFERLPILQHAEIIRNILYSGVWSKYELIHARRKKQQLKLEKKEASEKKEAVRQEMKKLDLERREMEKRARKLASSISGEACIEDENELQESDMLNGVIRRIRNSTGKKVTKEKNRAKSV